jgi:hypothetical protein
LNQPPPLWSRIVRGVGALAAQKNAESAALLNELWAVADDAGHIDREETKTLPRDGDSQAIAASGN